MYIDLSKYNRVTDWKAVSKNVEGAILRVGYRGYGSGKIVLDPMFETYAKQCYNYGIPFGLYFMSQAITPIEGLEEADFSLNYAEKYNASLPIFIDSEDGDGTAKLVRADALNVNDRTDICDMFCNTIVNNRRKGGIYASTSWFKNKLNVKKLDKYLLWVAQYGSEYTAKHRVDMWQYTSKGRIPGINGNVDCSILYGFPNTNYKEFKPTRNLKYGDRGDDVKELQMTLNNKFYFKLAVDGIFGAQTREAVKKVQAQYGLVTDGVVGVKTSLVLH